MGMMRQARSRKALAIGVGAMAMFVDGPLFSVKPVTAAERPCASLGELEALQIRHLQSRFVVAALSCGQEDAYNAFVARFQPELAAHGAKLIGYYQKVAGGTDALNKAVTELANAASKLRAEDPVGFCTATWNLFWSLENEPERLAAASAATFMYDVALPAQCQTPPIVSADVDGTGGEPMPKALPAP
jgi:hypothetical protein